MILPSEEFVPKHSHMLGIFQADQAKILKDAGYDVGVISVSIRLSLPMMIKAIALRPFGRKRENETDQMSFAQLFSVLFKKIIFPRDFIAKELYNDIPVYRAEGFYLMPPGQKSDYKWWVRAGKKAFERYISERGKPDIMHVHIALNAGLLAKEIKEKYGIPYIITERISFFTRGLYHSSLLPLARSAYNSSEQSLTVSDFLGKGLQKIFPGFQYQVLPNTVDPLIEKTPLPLQKQASFLILSIGNLIPLKRHDLLIEAFHRAFPKNLDVRLEIIGNGDEHENLNALIRELNEQERIQLSGRLSRGTILKRLDEAKVLCHQSQYETFCVAVLEALFRGVPVLSTRCGGPEEIIGERDGYLVPVDDIELFTEALKNIKNNYGDFSPVEIRQRAIKQFGSEIFLKRFSNIIKEVLPGRAVPSR